MDETLNRKKTTQFQIELILALIITGLACAAGLSNLLFTGNNFYPGATDFMGHMAKVKYIADCISQGQFPIWFPYWYTGSTVTQYYPPLSYWLMAPIYLATKNVMISFKINCLIMIFTGGMGVWYYCRIRIGYWCGLFGTVLFCLQPYILLNFYGAGLLAQGPIIALTPWYIISLFSYSEKPTAGRFFGCTVLCTLMILSHPMTIFMICLCVMIVFLVFVFLKKITMECYCYMGLTIAFAGLLTAFWSLVGVTGLENPGIPYLRPEAALTYTANINWFTTLSSGFFYYAIPITIGSIFAAFLFAYRTSKKITADGERYNILFCVALTAFTSVFSFGMNLPGFKYLPMAESFVPGRILGLTAVSGAILCAYLLYGVQKISKDKNTVKKISSAFFCLLIIGVALYYMNPFNASYPITSDKVFNRMISTTEMSGSHFEKGRYAYVCSVNSSETFFPLLNDINISDGWNIEGTTHNRTIWDFVIADPSGNYDYAAKYMAYWNVRYLYLSPNFDQVEKALNKKYRFSFRYDRVNGKFYASEDPSSYFLIDPRNALALGVGSPGLTIEFPYLISDERADITDYSIDELEKHKLIYLCEPEVKTIQDKDAVEKIVRQLIDHGVTVIIEPKIAGGYSLFNVTAADVSLENMPIIRKQPGSRINNAADNIKVDERLKYGRVLFGLDEVYYKLVQNNGELENDILGTKKVGNGEVIFIGNHLSQYLKAVYTRNFGAPENRNAGYYPECSDEIKSLFEDIFTTYEVNKNFWPDPFPVKNAKWNYKGVDFKYSSPAAKEMTLSVTYTPRWKATLDSKPIPVGQKENLITLDLPAGDHEVKLVYGLTEYGIAGYIISLLGLLIFILFIKFYDIILYRFRQICIKIGKFLQLGYDERQKIN